MKSVETLKLLANLDIELARIQKQLGEVSEELMYFDEDHLTYSYNKTLKAFLMIDEARANLFKRTEPRSTNGKVERWTPREDDNVYDTV